MSAHEEEPTLLLAPAPKPSAAPTGGQAGNAFNPAHGVEAITEVPPTKAGYPEPSFAEPVVVEATTASQNALQSWLSSLEASSDLSAARKQRKINSLMAAAQPLLSGLPLLRNTNYCPNVRDLHHTLVQSIKQFNADCQQIGIPNAHRISTRYMLCSALDEAVLSTPWGISSQWSHRSLLSLFHHETTGGEKVFQVLAQLQQQPREHLPVLEIYYLCLAMGFEGRFRLVSNGVEKRAHLKSELYTQCASFRPQAALGPTVSGPISDNTAHIHRPKPLWLGVLMTFVLLSVTYLGFNLWLNHLEAPLAAQLRTEINDIAQQDLTPREILSTDQAATGTTQSRTLP